MGHGCGITVMSIEKSQAGSLGEVEETKTKKQVQ